MNGPGHISDLVPFLWQIGVEGFGKGPVGRRGLTCKNEESGKGSCFLFLIMLKLAVFATREVIMRCSYFFLTKYFEMHVLYCHMGGLIPPNSIFASAQAIVCV